MTQAQARVQFADWLKMNHPAIFSQAIKIAENATNQNAGLGQMGPPVPTATIAVPTQSFWEKFSDAAVGLGTTYLTLENQKRAMKINLERAQAGLPPIDAATSAPVVRVQTDLSPELTNRLMSNVGSGLNRMLLLGAAAVAAFFFFNR